MEPFISEEMRELYVKRLNDNNRKTIETLNNEWRKHNNALWQQYLQWEKTGKKYIIPALDDPPPPLPEPEEVFKDWLNTNASELERSYDIADVPERLIPELVNTWRSLAIKIGFSSHEAEQFIQWRPRNIIESNIPEHKIEVECMDNLITMSINRVDHKSDIYHKALIKYFAIIMRNPLLIKFGEPDVTTHEQEEYAKKIQERSAWQATEIQHFVYFCFHFAGQILYESPIMIQSGWKETLKAEKTQRELIDEMAQELSNLPRFTAYAKVLEVQGKMGEIQSTRNEKIKTLKLEKQQEMGLVLSQRLQARKYGKSYCHDRTQIEKEITERQVNWKKQTRIETKIIQPSDEPPPTLFKGGLSKSTETKRNYSNREYSLFLSSGRGGLLHLAISGDNDADQSVVNVYPGSENLEKWLHFAAVVDRLRHKMDVYINGAMEGSTEDRYSTFNNGNYDLTLGWAEEQPRDFFSGAIDEVRIYRRALSRQEIGFLSKEGR